MNQADLSRMMARLMGFFLLGLVRVLTGAQARWQGCPPKAEQRIYFANHQSHADLLLIWAALPSELRSITRPIAAKDYWTKTPFKRWITTSVFNAIYVDRKNGGQIPISKNGGQIPISQGTSVPGSSPEDGRANLESDPHFSDPLEPLIDALESGDSVILFPEGTRGNQEEPQSFKSGLYNLALKFPQVVLVPAWITNVQRVMPKGEVVPVPILCSVTFGTPIALGLEESRSDFLVRARDAVMGLRQS